LEELINIKEAATYLRLNYMTVYKLAQKGRLPAFKVGGNWRFKKEVLDAWILKKAEPIKGLVLVVDDDLLIQDMLKEMVQDQGFTVSTAGTGESALKELGRKHFDIIFLDLMLPGLKGVDLVEAIKKKDNESVIVIITGYADDPFALKAMALGPLLLVRKPFRERDIIEALNIVMRKKG
jgi:excisionase family DNA binding protein